LTEFNLILECELHNLIDEVEDANDELDSFLDNTGNYLISVPTIYDVLKMELLNDVFDRYTLDELQSMFKDL